MSRVRAGEGEGSSAVAAVLAVAIALVPGVAHPGAAARAEVSVAAQDAPDADSVFRRQSYRLGWDHEVSAALRYELRLEFLDDRGTTSAPGIQDTTLRTWTLRPVAGLGWTGEHAHAAVTWQRAYRETLDAATDRMRPRWLDTLSAVVHYRPVEAFRSSASLVADGVSDPASGTRASTRRGTLDLEWRRGALRVTQTSRVSIAADDGRGTERIVYGPALEAAYARSFGDRATMTARYRVDLQRARDAVTGPSGSTALVELQPADGLYAVDDYPLDAAVPMARVPALVDGELGASAGVALGPDGVSFQNVAVDAGRSLTADELWVHVRDGAGNPVASGGAIGWSVYASDDGARWLAVAPAAVAFDVARSLYRVTFPATAARLFKAVSFGTNTLETYVTEVEVFHNEALLGRRTRTTSALVQGADAAVTWAPIRKLLLGVQGAVNATATGEDGAPRTWAAEGSQAYTAVAGPFRDVTLDVGHTRFDVARGAGRAGSSARTTRAGTRWRPLPTWDADVAAAWAADENAAARASTFSVSHAQRLQPYPWLRIALGASLTRQRIEAKTSPVEATARFAGGSALAEVRPTRALELRADAALQQQITRAETGATASLPIAQVVPSARYGVEAAWRPSAQLGVAARWGHVEWSGRSGFTQRYRLDWQPLPDGALGLSGSFDTEVDPLTGQRFRRVNAMPRLRVNPWSELGVTYSHVQRESDLESRWDQYVFATFSLRL